MSARQVTICEVCGSNDNVKKNPFGIAGALLDYNLCVLCRQNMAFILDQATTLPLAYWEAARLYVKNKEETN